MCVHLYIYIYIYIHIYIYTHVKWASLQVSLGIYGPRTSDMYLFAGHSPANVISAEKGLVPPSDTRWCLLVYILACLCGKDVQALLSSLSASSS